MRYDWNPKIEAWPDADAAVFKPLDTDPRLPISVEIRTSKSGEPQSDVSAQLRNFR